MVPCDSNQTRKWFNEIKTELFTVERKILEQVNIMTPKNIHVNAFMYEPIIDLSDWHLKKLFEDVKELNRANLEVFSEIAADVAE